MGLDGVNVDANASRGLDRLEVGAYVARGRHLERITTGRAVWSRVEIRREVKWRAVRWQERGGEGVGLDVNAKKSLSQGAELKRRLYAAAPGVSTGPRVASADEWWLCV